MLAQLRDVLAAEYSTIVPQKDQNSWLFVPKRSEGDFAAIGFRQHDIRQSFA